MTLSVTHLSTADIEGGSARSAYRIHSGLRNRGYVSRMLVGYKYSADPDVDTVSNTNWLRRADEIANRISQAAGAQNLLVPSTIRMSYHRFLASPDVIQLYNLHLGYFSYLRLPALSRRAPIVWRLSDLWAVTGHCAYPGACERWRTGCGKCPDLTTFPEIGIDTTAQAWRLKRWVYGRSRITVVAPSTWTESAARASPLFSGCAIHRIPNGIDLNVFRPGDRDAARHELGIPLEPKALLFSAHYATSNPRKGTDLLQRALEILGSRPDLVVLIAGKNAEAWRGSVPQTAIPLGYLEDDRMVAAAYAASDFVVAPSTVENLPNTIIEAMACRRPVVAFDVGGVGDAVRHGQTGLLVSGGDSKALAHAIAALIDDDVGRIRMGEAAFALVSKEFSAKLELDRFEDLYHSLAERAAA